MSSDLTSKTAYLYAGAVTNDQLTFSNAGAGINLKIPGHVALCYCALVTGVGEEMKCRFVLFVLFSSVYSYRVCRFRDPNLWTSILKFTLKGPKLGQRWRFSTSAVVR